LLVPEFLRIPDDLSAEQSAIAEGLTKVASRFDAQLHSDLPPVAKLVRHVEQYRGKMLRPTLALAAGMAAHPQVNSVEPAALIADAHITVAAVCEMVHMATLVHDDVLDEADTRRRGLTVNRLRGNEAAVILGDYLIAGAFYLCSTLSDQSTSLMVARTSLTLCAGELLQLHHREDFSLDEPTYFEIVARKTGDLIAAAAELGAKHSGAGEHVQRSLGEFGRKLGVAFQIQDDLLDLTGQASVVGKPVLQDLGKGKLTLPVIHHLRHASPEGRGQSLLLLRELAANPDANRAASLRDAIDATGSIRHARLAAERLVNEARLLLTSLPESRPRRLLDIMAEAVVARQF
jgi:octaprenyl-diphosphate synthase